MLNIQENIDNLTAELKTLKISKDYQPLFASADKITQNHGWKSLSKEPVVYPDTLLKVYYRTISNNDIFYFVGIYTKKTNIIKTTNYYILVNSNNDECPNHFIKTAKMMLSVKRMHNKNPSQ
jgi:hypothetical protein